MAVRVRPWVSPDAMEGEYAGALKVRLTAQPVDGPANKALREFFTGRLNVPISAVRILGERKQRQARNISSVGRQQVVDLLA